LVGFNREESDSKKDARIEYAYNRALENYKLLRELREEISDLKKIMHEAV